MKNKLAPVRREPTTLISGRSKHMVFKKIEFERSPNSVAATHVTPAPCLDESEPACPSDSNSYLPQTFRETSGDFGPLIGWAPLELPGTKLTQWQTLEVSDVKNTKREDAKGLLCSFIPSSKTNPGSILVLVCQTLNHFKMHVCYSCWIRLEDAKFG